MLNPRGSIDQIRLEIAKLELELHTIREECPPIVKSLKSLVKELKRKGKLEKGFFVQVLSEISRERSRQENIKTLERLIKQFEKVCEIRMLLSER